MRGVATTLLILLVVAASSPCDAGKPVEVWLGQSPYWEQTTKALATRDAKNDILAGKMKVLIFGLVLPTDEDGEDLEAKVLAKYGIERAYMGCIVGDESKLYADTYEAIVTKELERRYGKGFWVRVQKEIGEMAKANRKQAQGR